MKAELNAGVMLALLGALLFIAPSDQIYAQSRSFQMALWAQGDTAPGVDTDIPTFIDGPWDQPEGGLSILIRSNFYNPIHAIEYDWSRIVAVLVDEPYFEFDNLKGPCWSSTDVAAVNTRSQQLADRAAELKAVAPLTRFWINLAQPQLDWMRGPQCTDKNLAPVNVIKPYIDVISVDIYEESFDPGVKQYYVWLDANRAKPDQQMALIPGTFHRSKPGAPTSADMAGYLHSYFEYANTMNEDCNLPLGSRGLTGSYDGCRIWIVLGWLAYTFTENGYSYMGERDPASWPIANVWQGELAKPLRPDLAHQLTRGQLLPAILPLILE